MILIESISSLLHVLVLFTFITFWGGGGGCSNKTFTKTIHGTNISNYTTYSQVCSCLQFSADLLTHVCMKQKQKVLTIQSYSVL